MLTGWFLLDASCVACFFCRRDGRAKILKGILRAFGKDMTAKDLEKPPRRPGGRGASTSPWVRIGPFWLEGGPIDPIDAAKMDPDTKQRR